MKNSLYSRVVSFFIGVIGMLLFLFAFTSLSSCSEDTTPTMMDNSKNSSRFVLVETIGDSTVWDSIYVDTKTGVEYFVHCENHGNGGYTSWGTVLMGQDGLPLLAEGYERGDMSQ